MGQLPLNGFDRIMDLYTFLLVLGGAGLVIMALQGLGGAHFGGHGHGAHSHAGHSGHGHVGHGHVGGSHSHSHSHSHSDGGAAGRFLWSFASPRVWFSVALGTGLAGHLMRPVMGGGVFLFASAIGLGLIFEGALVRPMWNFSMKFASQPALTLESCVEDEGTAVTSFDKNGQGIISIDLDGQMVQLLATLRADDRALGAAVRAGDRVRIADVDSARNSCTVAVL
jgi:hypothetical protein